MIEILAIILFLVLASRITEEFTGIPINLPLIAFSYFVSAMFPGALGISPEFFDEILIMLLPIILFPDVINLSLKQVRENLLEISYLAFFGVGVSLVLAIMAGHFYPWKASLSLAELACLFAPLLATDAITVTSMAGKFDLPKRLKLIAEGESLFNDATALIAFYFIALPLLSHGEVAFASVSETLIEVFVSSILIGVVVALAGFALLKLLRDPIEQFSSAYLVAIGAFLIADHWQYSGILALLFSLMLFRLLIDKEVKRGLIFNYELHKELLDTENSAQKPPSLTVLKRLLLRVETLLLRTPALTSVSFRTYRKEALYVGMFANAILFILLAQLLDAGLLLKYAPEIVFTFLLTTGLRFLLVSSLSVIRRFPIRWSNALTLSGMKGGLAIIMIHSLPDNLGSKEMLEAIVLGVVILSIFIYTLLLLLYLAIKSNEFKCDLITEENISDAESLIEEIEHAVEYDPVINIFHKVKFNEILRREIERSQRYNTPLSLILIEFVNYSETINILGKDRTDELLKGLSTILEGGVSTLDNIGRISENKAAVLTINRTPEEDLEVAGLIKEKMSSYTKQEGIAVNLCFSIANYVEGDPPAMLYEKAEEALERARSSGCRMIGIAM